MADEQTQKINNDIVELQKFWDFVTHGKDEYFELRTNNYEYSKTIGEKYKVPYSVSGVYVNSFEKFRDIVLGVRDYIPISLSVNPRRKCFVPETNHKVFTGTYESIDGIYNIMIDIDRVKRKRLFDNEYEALGQTPPTDEELNGLTREKYNKMKDFADFLIERLQSQGITSVMKLFSGNGLHLLIPIEKLRIPEQVFDADLNAYDFHKEFHKIKLVVEQSFGEVIKYNMNKKKEKYECFVDEKSFLLNKHICIPTTYSFKGAKRVKKKLLKIYGGKCEEMTILTDLFVNNLDKVTTEKDKKHFGNKIRNMLVAGDEKRNYKNIKESPLVKFLLSEKLAEGERSSLLIFPLKILIQKSGLDFANPVIQNLKKEIQKVQKDVFPFNPPSEFTIFTVTPVNKYCVLNRYTLVYEFKPELKINRNFNEYDEFDEYCYERYLCYAKSHEKDEHIVDFSGYEKKNMYDDLCWFFDLIREKCYEYKFVVGKDPNFNHNSKILENISLAFEILYENYDKDYVTYCYKNYAPLIFSKA